MRLFDWIYVLLPERDSLGNCFLYGDLIVHCGPGNVTGTSLCFIGFGQPDRLLVGKGEKEFSSDIKC